MYENTLVYNIQKVRIDIRKIKEKNGVTRPILEVMIQLGVTIFT